MRPSLVLLAVVLAAPALAQPTPPALETLPAPVPPRVDVLGAVDLELGGDDVLELQFTNGESQTLTAGQGGTIALGVRVRPAPRLPVSTFASVGYKVLFNASSDADIRLTRIPLELGATVHPTPAVWAEAAYVRHAAIRLHGDDFFQDVEFEGANGATVSAGWKWIGASYTAIRYTADDGSTLDASNVGLTLRISGADF